ncbi:Zinc finger CCCH domain protein [Rhynchospora pubera]|uniref:Zinc finger CCCH domain protein n=1 Tax=Rhynchospora pubera TaxID=906938 RepID=A0AAV8E6X2_9POAL|nr:Zinc finger CCCH domain protein [Rhynchospora pubera]
MYSFKVKRCLNRRGHNWASCPYAHHGERFQRRDPCKFRYRRQMCRASDDFTKCCRGMKCKYAHGLYEYWLHPNRYRTRMCNRGLACHRRVCFFAHSLQQLRQVIGLNTDYATIANGGNMHLFSLPREPPRNTPVIHERGETSGTSRQGRFHERLGIDQAMKNSDMDRIMKLLDDLEDELV